MGDLTDRVLGGEHLALLGHLQAAVDGARRQRQDRVVGRTAAAPDRAAPAVEEDPADAVASQHLGDPTLSAVGPPAGCHVADVLVGVGVADHDLLVIPDRAQRLAVDRCRKQRLERLRGAASVAPASNSGTIRSFASAPPASARLASFIKQQHLEHVGRPLVPGDDVGVDRTPVRAIEHTLDHAEGLDHLAGGLAEAARCRRGSAGAVR